MNTQKTINKSINKVPFTEVDKKTKQQQQNTYKYIKEHPGVHYTQGKNIDPPYVSQY